MSNKDPYVPIYVSRHVKILLSILEENIVYSETGTRNNVADKVLALHKIYAKGYRERYKGFEDGIFNSIEI